MSGVGRLAEVERDSEAAVSNPGESWTILRVILWSAEYLTEKGVEAGRLDAEWLLAAALGVDRLQLYLQFDRPLSPEEREIYIEEMRKPRYLHVGDVHLVNGYEAAMAVGLDARSAAAEGSLR